jgi:arylsulfatase A-like enzyme
MNDTRPNIVFVITDQQRYDTIAALGHPHMITPRLDRMVAEGTAFTQCHVAGASCVPARSALFTGYYPHTTGILKNADLWRHGWVESLADAGYHCVNVGKMHTWPLDTPFGFHQRHVVENKDRFLEARWFFDEWDRALASRGLVKQQRTQYRQLPDYRERLGAFEWRLPADSHSDAFVGGRARWWVDTHPKTGPLFLQVGFPGPHPPYDPTPEALAEYLDRDLPIDPVLDTDLAGQPPPFQELRRHNVEIDHDSVVHQLAPSMADRRRQRAHYMANVSMIDRELDALLASLERAGYLENAVVVFTSDHGDCLGDHGHSQKWTMYEQVTRVPFIVWSPGRVPAGRRCDALVQPMDVVPWLLELAGARAPEGIEAESLAPAFNDPAWAGRDAVYCEQGRDNILTDAEFMTMVRTRDHKLVHFLHAEYGQLFDLRTDPGETVDLWNDPAHAPVRRQMLDRLAEWRIESQWRTRDWMREHR